MSYFFDIELHTEKLGTVKQRGRVYRVVDRKDNFKWYEITQETRIGGDVLCDASFAVFDLNMFHISQDDLDRALTRRTKIAA
jgi:hypothetical protein